MGKKQNHQSGYPFEAGRRMQCKCKDPRGDKIKRKKNYFQKCRQWRNKISHEKRRTILYHPKINSGGNKKFHQPVQGLYFLPAHFFIAGNGCAGKEITTIVGRTERLYYDADTTST